MYRYVRKAEYSLTVTKRILEMFRIKNRGLRFKTNSHVTNKKKDKIRIAFWMILNNTKGEPL